MMRKLITSNDVLILEETMLIISVVLKCFSNIDNDDDVFTVG